MLAVKNFFLPERTKAPDTPQRFSRMPEAFLRSIRRRSLRVKRAKSLVVPDREKRKSGEVACCADKHREINLNLSVYTIYREIKQRVICKHYKV